MRNFLILYSLETPHATLFITYVLHRRIVSRTYAYLISRLKAFSWKREKNLPLKLTALYAAHLALSRFYENRATRQLNYRVSSLEF